MHEFFEFGIEGSFESRHVGWLGKVDRQDDCSSGFCDKIHELVFLSGSFEDSFESKFFGERVSAQSILFVEGIEDKESAALDVFLDRFEGRVRFGFWQIRCGPIGAKCSVVPLGIEECLAGKSDGPHGARWIASGATVS